MSKATECGARGAFLITRCHSDITHPIYCSARKLRRVAWSSSTAELLAASDAESALTYLRVLILELTYNHECTMIVESWALLHLSTPIREPKEAANKIDLDFRN